MNTPQLSIKTVFHPSDLYSDSRTHGYQGPSRNVRLTRITPPGGGAIAKSEDGVRCAITGKESLRIVRLSEPSQNNNPEHKFAVGRGGHRIDASRNFWDASGLKIDSASTDVAWGHGSFNNKILTSARNGELIMWDLNKSGSTKYERRTKDHLRSINKMSVSHIVHHYCITGSADGHMRVWDLRDMSKSIMKVHHPISVRSLVFSPSFWRPLQAIVGLDNGSIYRWDLRVGQRGQLDKLPVAHSAPVTSLDWCCAGGVTSQGSTALGTASQSESGAGGLGWLVSGSLDRCVKVWDLTAQGSSSHIPHKATYTLHPPFAVRRVSWRPGYECEVAIASSTEFTASTSDTSQLSPNASGLMTRVGSGLGLDALLRGSSGPESIYGMKDKLNPSSISGSTTPIFPSRIGDVVEIWDVRRSWIAKWSVTGSAAEGGVTDIAFGDSHALWTQNASGAFSQLDLRDTTKPIDAIPRVAATWEATGSVAFVVDRKERWEIPYDDLASEQRKASDVRKLKALGDPPACAKTQITATYVHDFSLNDLDVFTTLARRYIFEGQDRKDICVYNSGVALSAGQESAAQVWSLLGACLTQYLPIYPPTPPLSPPSNLKKVPSSIVPQTSPQPPSTMSPYTFPNKANESVLSLGQKIGPGRRLSNNADSSSRVPSHRSSSASHRLTPTSSTSSSPRHHPIALPPLTPRGASFFGRRESMDSDGLRTSALLRRPSLSVPPGQSASPTDRSSPSLRHVGEGVLDDSDSTGSDNEGGEDTAGVNSSEDENLRPPLSPGLAPIRTTAPTPSPLSRVARGRTWSDDGDETEHDEEEDSSSPSPQSADTDSEGSVSPNRSRTFKLLRRSSGRVLVSRSRSSTVASLAAPPPRPLIHQDSQSSIRTVTVQGTPTRDNGDYYEVSQAGDNVYQYPENKSTHSRRESRAISELPLNNGRTAAPVEEKLANEAFDEGKLTDRRIQIIRREDRRFKETTLAALRDVLEGLADEGDVQMCALLVLVAPEELRVSSARVTRFVESYIELLERLKLFTCAAYLRKYCQAEALRKLTLTGTTIYTTCGKCRKPLLMPAGTFSAGRLNRGSFSYCTGCKASCVTCSICRLPVRTLLFQCSICHHGGHQACYREYHMRQAVVDLPTCFLPLSLHDHRGRPSARTTPPTLVEDDNSSMVSSMAETFETFPMQSPVQPSRMGKIAGYLCAAGCGHFCWAVNRDFEEM